MTENISTSNNYIHSFMLSYINSSITHSFPKCIYTYIFPHNKHTYSCDSTLHKRPNISTIIPHSSAYIHSMIHPTITSLINASLRNYSLYKNTLLLRPSVLLLNINVCDKHINITLNIWFCKKIINTSLYDLHVTAK